MSRVVLKFGSSVLRGPGQLGEAVHEIYRHVRAGREVVAVVSALGATTDRLLAEAGARGGDPASLAALLATGEQEAVGLLTEALAGSGVPARGLHWRELGLAVRGADRLDAEPVSVDSAGLTVADGEGVAVVVVPGFVGVHADGGAALLGRGGSDLTALVVAEALAAPCTLLKDVPGVFAWDPADSAAVPPRFETITFARAARLGGALLQRKALDFAAARGLQFRVTACGAAAATIVGAASSRLEAATAEVPPVRVGVLGCGVVGGGVVAELLRMPDRFEVTGVAVRDLDRPRDAGGLGRDRFTDRPWLLLEAGVDMLVHAAPGAAPDCAAVVEEALARGLDVVTADKRLVAEHGVGLRDRARWSGARLRCAATVGGAVPMLEATRRAARRGTVNALEGVLNGTSNFVLERLCAGSPLDAALAAARRAGLAEADAAADLDGRDAARKLVLLAEAAWGQQLTVDDVAREPIPERLAAPAGGVAWRQVARVERDPDSGALRAAVTVEQVAGSSAAPWAGLRGADNALRIRVGPREVVVRGVGAGRGPTTLAVVADLLELRRTRRLETLGGAR